MGVLLAIVQLSLIILILLKEVQEKSPAMFLWATLLVMFGIMHFLEIVLGSNRYSDRIMNNASLFVILFCLFYAATRRLLFSRRNNENRDALFSVSRGRTPIEGNIHILLAFFLICSFEIAKEVIVGSGGIWNTSWGNAYAISVNQSYLSGTQIWMLGYNAMGGLLCCAIVKRDRALILITLFALSFVEVVTRNRGLVLPLVISIIAVVIFRVKRVSFRTIFFGAIGAVLVIYLVYAIRAFRWLGTLSDAVNTFSFSRLNDQIKQFLITSDGELGLRNWMYYYMEHNNNFESFGQGHTYIRMLLVYIPTRFSMGLKPDDFAIAMGAASSRYRNR